MSDASNVARSLRERLSGTTEERLGKALSDLLENPLLTGAIGRAFDAREKAVQAQEVAMGALNIPSAADIERLTRRLRSVSHRLEGIEDGRRPPRPRARAEAAASERGSSQRLSADRGPAGDARPAELDRGGRKPAESGETRAKPRRPARNPRKPDALRPPARRSPPRPIRSAASSSAWSSMRVRAAARVERVGHGQHAGDRHARGGAHSEQRRRLHLDRQRVRRPERGSPSS